MLRLHRTVVEGYKEKTLPSRIVYGVALHKFIDVMYRTKGHIPTAREAAKECFLTIPKIDEHRSMHLSDLNHMLSVALWTWEMCVIKDDTFEILEINDTCEKCKGTGSTYEDKICSDCCGNGYILRPATEVTFSIPYYHDAYVSINWCGTLDRIGKIKNGIYVVPDWKTTSAWDEKTYFKQYQMARAPRGYILALKMMSELYPDSILGKIGGGVVGARFDGIFIKPAINDVKFARSEVFRYPEKKLNEFRLLLDDKCREISQAVKTEYYPKQGLINGSCQGKWGMCPFWSVCQLPEVIGDMVLKRDFDKKPFNPLAYND
jgi:hypothetical protein